jgi:hypothetical protein
LQLRRHRQESITTELANTGLISEFLRRNERDNTHLASHDDTRFAEQNAHRGHFAAQRLGQPIAEIRLGRHSRRLPPRHHYYFIQPRDYSAIILAADILIRADAFAQAFRSRTLSDFAPITSMMMLLLRVLIRSSHQRHFMLLRAIALMMHSNS